ncbi:MAG: hypothetical protein A2015_15265 [Spirochaetes bacterium GWF1_31_7]|nr:MAG: hypothetical protein A2Y30_11690 [Spirochaetes bacterium GWE1_32_154]OHD51180.1 MAG: hypothetical protein A2Y29_01230 [Spirochaetes bacterium GWE2_31_10]OHD52099.1 MAG: hypothetical protein A2015_15265 [Spirochaetes bacterium GWF1_31_7]HBD93273.1 GNAT family N-acetyltransferase [Spirochaetia bacterium]
MGDMLVKLYDLDFSKISKETFSDEISIVRALSPDKHKVLSFVKEKFSENWVSECEKSFMNNPISCFIAVKEKKIIGFGCYDATAKGFFGPTGIEEKNRNQGIGAKILLSCMKDMWDHEYGYAIIGWTFKARKFYEKIVGAIEIENSFPGIYKRMIDFCGDVEKK